MPAPSGRRREVEAGADRVVDVREGDATGLTAAEESYDAVFAYHVLHHAEAWRGVVHEAARVLRPGGRLVVVDFAPHQLEFLREEHAHRRLGFADEEMRGWFTALGLAPEPPVRLPGDPLTVVVWPARREGVADDSRDRLLGMNVA